MTRTTNPTTGVIGPRVRHLEGRWAGSGEAAEVVRALGARTVPDAPDRGLNPALDHGALSTGAVAVAALSSDLPALRPQELAAALAAAAAADRCFVADAAGTGTTLLTAVG